MTINSNLGLAPWDVFPSRAIKFNWHYNRRTHILTGISIVALSSVFGEKIG